MLHIHLSNRFEMLAALWLRQMAAPQTEHGDIASLFQPRQVIVPSLAMRRALTLELARQEGVCTQVQFSFLAPWLWSSLAGAGPRQSPFASSTLVWRVFDALCDHEFLTAQPRLAAYLSQGDTLMPFELASRAAGLLEQYASYRADALHAWTHGKPWPDAAAASHPDGPWQATLWRRVSAAIEVQTGKPLDPAATDLLRDLHARPLQAAHTTRTAPMAPTAHVFGLPTLPPLHLQWLQAVAQHIDVHLYVLNPCQEHWFDLVDPRRLAKLRTRGLSQGFEVGNALLSTWGQQTQVHLDALVNTTGAQVADDAVYVPASGTTLLAQVQNAVLELRELNPGSVHLAPQDRSLEVHVCHSMTRQLEVLHNHLLGLVAQAQAAGRPWHPGRVLVAVPDLDAAAPLIDAVFGTVPPSRRLPYVLTGQAQAATQGNPAAKALLDVLALAGSRWAASDVFALLQQPLVATRFGLLAGHDDEGLQQVRDWIAQAGIRWGADACHRGHLDLPATSHHTWADGLARLFLGYAVPSSTAAPWNDLLPAGGAQGLGAQALGSLWAFVQALGDLQAQTAQPLPAAQWAALLHSLVPRFMRAPLHTSLHTSQQGQPRDSTADDALLDLQRAIAELAANWHGSQQQAPLSLAVVRAALSQQLDASAPGGVPGGAVTFAAMASLRGLPYDVVCVLGLDDGAWPSGSRPLEFDLMAAAPRRGDRHRRSEERNIFLDLLMGARSSLFLATTGRSLRDNTPLPPSVLVSELLDAVLPALADYADDPAAARARLVVEHPLAPFARLSFNPATDIRLRSHDADMAQALQQADMQQPSAAGLAVPTRGDTGEGADETGYAGDGEGEGEDSVDAGATQRPFFNAPLPPYTPPLHTVTLQDLLRFFRHPSRELLEARLGIRLNVGDDALQDDEAFVPDRAAQRELATLLLPALLHGAGPETALQAARASPVWPPGDLGTAALAAEVDALVNFAAHARAATASAVMPPLHVSDTFQIDGIPWTLVGSFTDLRPEGLVRWRTPPAAAATPAQGPDLLNAWLQHLLLCLGLQRTARSDVSPVTTWLAADSDWVFNSVADPHHHLHTLLALFEQGHCQPLHFYPRTSWVQASKPGSDSAARTMWAANPHKPFADSADAYNRLALRGVADPLDDHFRELAQTVFGPLLAHLRGADAMEGSDDDA